MSGVFYVGLGDQFDGDKAKAYPPGSVIVLPGNTSAIGLLGLEYPDPGDESRELGHDHKDGPPQG